MAASSMVHAAATACATTNATAVATKVKVASVVSSRPRSQVATHILMDERAFDGLKPGNRMRHTARQGEPHLALDRPLSPCSDRPSRKGYLRRAPRRGERHGHLVGGRRGVRVPKALGGHLKPASSVGGHAAGVARFCRPHYRGLPPPARKLRYLFTARSRVTCPRAASDGAGASTGGRKHCGAEQDGTAEWVHRERRSPGERPRGDRVGVCGAWPAASGR